MIEEIKAYVLSCDCCGEELMCDDYCPVFDTEKEVRETAKEQGWVEYEPGKFACEDCAETHNKEAYEED